MCRNGPLMQGVTLVYETGAILKNLAIRSGYRPQCGCCRYSAAHFRVQSNLRRHGSWNQRNVTTRDFALCYECYSNLASYACGGEVSDDMLVHCEKVAAIFEASDELRAYSHVVPSIDDAWNEEGDMQTKCYMSETSTFCASVSWDPFACFL